MSAAKSAIEAAKRLAAYSAVDHHIFPHHKAREPCSPETRTDGSSHSRSLASARVCRPPRLTRVAQRRRLDGALRRRAHHRPGGGSQQGAHFHPYRYALLHSRAPVTHQTCGLAGFQSKNLIVDGGLALGDIEQYPEIDVTIDGADECAYARPSAFARCSAHARAQD